MRTIILSVALFVLSSRGWAVEVEPNVQYPAGTSLEIGTMGLTMVVPPDFFGGMIEGGAGALVFGSNTKVGMLMAFPMAQVDTDTARSWLTEPMDLGEGVVLAPSGSPSVDARSAEMSYQVTQNGIPNAEAYGHLKGQFGGQGSMVAFLVLGPAAEKAQLDRLLDTLNDSTKFSTASGPPPRLVGCWSYYQGSVDAGFNSSVSGSIVFNADGTFHERSRSSASLDGFDSSGIQTGNTSAMDKSEDSGTFKVVGNVIHFVDTKGGNWTQEYSVSGVASYPVLYMAGNRWKRCD